MPKTFQLNGEEYEQVTKQGQVLSGALVYAWMKLGKPQDPLSESGKKLVNIIIAAYEDTFPREWYDWLEERKEYQVNEKTIKEQVHENTGRSLASYPMFIYKLLKTLFPTTDFGNREFILKFIKEFPMFRMANRA